VVSVVVAVAVVFGVVFEVVVEVVVEVVFELEFEVSVVVAVVFEVVVEVSVGVETMTCDFDLPVRGRPVRIGRAGNSLRRSLMMPKKSNSKRWVIVGNGPYGLWFGKVKDTDSKIISDRAVRLYSARNIRYWYGKTGGITSLAASGPCGPRAQESRIGAEIASTLLLDVKAVHDCAPEAVAAFAAIVTR
jgi:hypothetical protein